jgi:hypothetical protein
MVRFPVLEFGGTVNMGTIRRERVVISNGSSQKVYFKRNVNYTIGVREYPGDWQGIALTTEEPWVSVDIDGLKDFKRANKYLFERGMLLEIEEPSTDYENANLITDESAAELVGNIFKLKKVLKNVTAETAVRKLLETAKDKRRPSATIELIEAKLEEVSEEITPLTMRGVTN